MTDIENKIKHTVDAIKGSSGPKEKREILFHAIKGLPKTSEVLPLYQLSLDEVSMIKDSSERTVSLLELLKEIPSTNDFLPLYSKAVELTIDAVGSIMEPISRKSKLLRIADELPKTEEFTGLRIQALRIAMGLSDKPHHVKASLAEIARELPKSSDYEFYRRHTLLGIAGIVPKTGEFMSLYKEAIRLAMDAAGVIEEPYYREYALLYIARELPDTEECFFLYKEAMTEAYKAASALNDLIARKYALLDILKALPRTAEFFTLFQQIIKQALEFYSVRKSMEDVEILGRLDYFLAGEQRKITESKKARYAKAKYAVLLARELEDFGLQLNDIRLIETIQPYTHVWIQPPEIRDTARKVVNHLEALRTAYHGKEVERPVFVGEYYPASKIHARRKKKEAVEDSLSIDVGATNTVIMRKKGDAQPAFISLGPISKAYGEAYTVPTLLSRETNAIGLEAIGKEPVMDIKKMLLSGSPKGRDYMERYIRILYQHLKKALGSGRFPFFSGSLADMLYITVPVGFQDYKRAMREIIEKTIKGVKIEFIEEPLAAAVGYQVAEERDKVAMLVDFGGSTLDVMVLRLNIDEVHVAAKPDRSKILGGHDIDLWLADFLGRKAGITGDVLPALVLKAEEIKISLSEHRAVPFEWDGVEVCRVTREDLEEVLAEHDFYKVVDRTVSYVLKKAEKVGIRKDMIETVLLTGGSSQIPSFKEKIDHIFPRLRGQNAIYDHDPLSAVARGAALYGTRDIFDRHLSMAYAVRYATKNKDAPFSYEVVLEKGEPLPLEKAFKITPANILGIQDEIYLELFEVPEGLIVRRWVTEGGIEFIKQEIKYTHGMSLKGFEIITLPAKESPDDADMTFCINETGHLKIKYGKEAVELETTIRLQ